MTTTQDPIEIKAPPEGLRDAIMDQWRVAVKQHEEILRNDAGKSLDERAEEMLRVLALMDRIRLDNERLPDKAQMHINLKLGALPTLAYLPHDEREPMLRRLHAPYDVINNVAKNDPPMLLTFRAQLMRAVMAELDNYKEFNGLMAGLDNDSKFNQRMTEFNELMTEFIELSQGE